MNGANAPIPPRNGTQPDTRRRASLHSRVERHIGRRILAGFLVLLPLIITAWILVFAYHQINALFARTIPSSDWNHGTWRQPPYGSAHISRRDKCSVRSGGYCTSSACS